MSPPSKKAATKRKLSTTGALEEGAENHRGGGPDRHDETSGGGAAAVVDPHNSNGDKQGGSTREEETSCPYLDSIQRTVLDFDFEPACSVSLETGPHIYGCLVCGKFFRGKGPATPAYTHSVEESHFVFVHLRKGTFVCLPDGYEVRDPSLDDIKACLHPTYTPEQIAAIDARTDLSRDLFGRRYLPGYVGLNNLNKTDCLNAVVQALAQVPPLRDFFLAQRHDQDDATSMVATAAGRESASLPSGKALKRSRAANPTSVNPHHRAAVSVTHAFGELVRKLWCPHRFKSHVDPHILVQAVSNASHKKFHVGRRAEAGELMAWFLHQLHVGTGGGKKPGSSIVHHIFQGDVQVTTRQVKRVHPDGGANAKEETDDRAGSDDEQDGNGEPNDAVMTEAHPDEIVVEETTVDTHFLQLTLDIPEKPLFRDEDGGLVIPQEPFVNVLKKFDGVTLSDAVTRSGVAQKKRYKLRRLPDYLILHLARFKENKYSREKNPAIVTFPLTNFDLTNYVDRSYGPDSPAPPTVDEIRNMSVRIVS
jgi:U4/U6.U5 tri-snRNP-associated protein 2